MNEKKGGDEIAMAIKTIEEKIRALETARDVLLSLGVPQQTAISSPQSWANMSHKDAILAVLKTAPRPLKPSRIASMLESYGHSIGLNTLRSILSVCKRRGLVDRKQTGWAYLRAE